MQIFLKLLAVLLICSSAKAYSPDEVVPNEVIVKFKEGQGSIAVQGKVAASFQLKSEKSWKNLNLHQFKTQKGQNLESLISDLKQDPNVEFAEPNFYVFASNMPYNMTTVPVRIREAWAQLPADPGPLNQLPIVAVIDSGLDTGHPVYNQTNRVYNNTGEIPGNGIDDDGNGFVDDVSGWNFINSTNNVFDDTGHGTHVAGIVLGTTENIFSFNKFNSPRVQILPLKFLNASGVGKTSDAINAIYYAINRGAKVINNSWGGSNYSSTLHSALTSAYNNGIVIVSAAGNDFTNNDSKAIYPASLDLPSMISVASTDSNRTWQNVTESDELVANQCRSYFTNYGRNTVDLFAPGYSIKSTFPLNKSIDGFEFLTGTSMAAPFVAGLAAMIASIAPNLSGFQIKELLVESSDYSATCHIYTKSGRRLNFESSVIAAMEFMDEPSFQPNYRPLYSQGDRALASTESVSSGFGCGRVADVYKDQNNSFHRKNNEGTQSAMDAKINLDILFLMIPLVLLLMYRRKFSQKNTRAYVRKIVNLPGQMILDNGWVLPVNVKDLSASGAGIQLLGDASNYNFRTSSGHMILNLIFGDGQKVRYKAQVVRSTENGFVGVRFKEN